MSQFYAVKTETDSNYDDSQHTRDKEEDSSDKENKEKWKEVLELILYPALKKRLLPQKMEHDEEKLFIKVASLPELYKVFERC